VVQGFRVRRIILRLRRFGNAKLALVQRRIEQRGEMFSKRRDLGPRGLRKGSRFAGGFRSFDHAANMGRIRRGSKGYGVRRRDGFGFTRYADGERLNTSAYKRCLGHHNPYLFRNHGPRKFKIFILVSARTHNDSLDRQSGVERLKQRDVFA
jgi:hypothetical protein